jgi:hypothetical protein
MLNVCYVICMLCYMYVMLNVCYVICIVTIKVFVESDFI